MKKIVVIGGGTGLSSMLMGMKNLEDIELSAIVTVADSGGSTGRIIVITKRSTVTSGWPQSDCL